MAWTFGTTIAHDEAYRQMVGPDHFSVKWHRSGSYDHALVRPRLRMPFEVNWDRSVRFDHDFTGRAPHGHTALERRGRRRHIRLALPRRRGYKAMELPTTPTWLNGFTEHADRVLLDGREVGISSGNIYSYHFRQSLSMGCIDIGLTEAGTELIVEWGDHGRRIKPVRVTVDRFPYLSENRNDTVVAKAP